MRNKIRTVSLVHDVTRPLQTSAFRQWPGQWPGGSATVGNSFFLPAIDGAFNADWLVCGTPPPSTITTNVPFERRIFLVQEPPEFWSVSEQILSMFRWIICPYHVGDPHPQIVTRYVPHNWWYGIEVRSSGGHIFGPGGLTLEQIEAEKQPKKMPKMSTIVSQKSFLPGHRKRLLFTLKLKEALGDLLDIYGHGFRDIPDKRDALLDYKFHFAAENSCHAHYWTEKLADPLLARCRTFYCGATKIDDYFDSSAVLSLNLDEVDGSIQKIKWSIENEHVDIGAIDRARHDVLYKYNLPFYIDKLIDELEIALYQSRPHRESA